MLSLEDKVARILVITRVVCPITAFSEDDIYGKDMSTMLIL